MCAKTQNNDVPCEQRLRRAEDLLDQAWRALNDWGQAPYTMNAIADFLEHREESQGVR